jgi:replicative DNA helicase
MDISALVLHKILAEQNLEAWAKVKLAFIDPAYSSIYAAISKHYNQYSTIPNFEELELGTRAAQAKATLAALSLLEAPEISIDVAIDALIDQYTQNETIRMLDKFIDKLPIYDTEEVKEQLAVMLSSLDEKTMTAEGVYTMDNIMLFQDDEDLAASRFPLGINNTFDSVLGGVARQEYILIGGKRGSGKSIAANNVMVNQYEAGNTSVFFTIEMSGHETFQRTMSILADVNHRELKQNKLSHEDNLKVVQARADMFLDANDLVEEFKHHHDKKRFEERLNRTKTLKPDNQMIIIDDRGLTVTSIDIHLGKLKAKFGDKLTVCVVDYINQIRVEGGGSQYDWQPQVEVSTKLKELARKHDVIMISPYQIDVNGEARFAKGILDSADIALVMEAHDKETSALTFSTTKIRGDSDMIFTSPIEWDTLRICAMDIPTPKKPEKEKKGPKNAAVKKYDTDADLPWD